MRILIAGDWHSDTHEEPLRRAFESEGHEVSRFAWHEYFAAANAQPTTHPLRRLAAKAQKRYLAGPALARLNRDLLQAARLGRPDVLFVYRGTHVTVRTMESLRALEPRPLLVGYNNDDPFSNRQPRSFWRHFLAGVPLYDLLFAYRAHNVLEYRRAGARNVEVLRSWFVAERHRPVELTAEERERFGCDVVFAGHYEPDGRIEHLEAVAGTGVQMRLFGPDWPDRLPAGLQRFAPVRAIRGEDYVKALCAAKVALCFLSTTNRDTYTRRCFEIPAVGTLMLATRTTDLKTLFEEGREADYFDSPGELVRKLMSYLRDDARRREVAAAGRRRVHTDGHDVRARARFLADRFRNAIAGRKNS